ncbi:MAG: exo-alpha-sialidase [Halobacteriales archaeon]|nr:exo-alpha-sialidase [Halobacteriales archaeon]
MRRAHLALVLVALLASTAPAWPLPGTDTAVPAGQVFVHNNAGFTGLPAGMGPSFDVRVAHLGRSGPEPSTGATSDGSIFFQALTKTLRSRDDGMTWQDVTPPTANPQTFDPMLYVDTATDRVYADQLGVGGNIDCSWAVWSDLKGDAWNGVNPFFCNLVPPGVTDHQKISTGALPPGLVPVGNLLPPLPVGTRATYYTWNTGAVTKLAISVDGGQTFPLTAQAAQGTCNGGLMGRTRSFPDGSLIVPKRDCGAPQAAVSADFQHWQQVPVTGAGTTGHRKNPDIAIDDAGNAYFFFSGLDEATWMAVSGDKGHTWSAPVRASPPNVLTATMQSGVAGVPGRVALLYYGSDESNAAPDHVPQTAHWHTYLAISYDALSANPTWVTLQLDDNANPTQVGCISTNTDGHCGHRNLLDFTDLVADKAGRVIAAYADGCTPGCTYGTSTGAEGVAAVLLSGATLR